MKHVISVCNNNIIAMAIGCKYSSCWYN